MDNSGGILFDSRVQRRQLSTWLWSVSPSTTRPPFPVHINHPGAQLAAGLVAKPAPAADGQQDGSDELPPEDAVVGGCTG